MTRAAVLIGTNRTGKLPVLHDAVEGACRMEQWALLQGMARDRVLRFTDEGGSVDVSDIRRAIRKLVDSGAIKQLIVYFAGHGVNIRYGEYWLLTDAPEDSSAAINVEGSIVLARRCGIPHVVFISDACRTAAEGLQAQGVTGTEIFPNDPVAGPESPVDIFFGTALGRPALEVKDPGASSAVFKAVYTTALLDALTGRLPAVLTSAMLEGRYMQLVRPRPLKTLMLTELPKRLAALQLSADVTQIPDARITSDDDAWLASLEPTATLSSTKRSLARGAPPVTPTEAAQNMLKLMLGSHSTRRVTRTRPRLARSIEGEFPSSWPGPSIAVGAQFPTRCGFKLMGTGVTEALSARARVEVKPDEPTLVHVDTTDAAVNVLLRLADGTGVVLPAVRDFVTLVTVAAEEVVAVAWEPCENTARGLVFSRHAPAVRDLREAVSNAARDNAFRLDETLADLMDSHVGYEGHPDLSLALHTAYALHELGRADRVHMLARVLEMDLGVRFFDLNLLSMSGGAPGQVPPLPMLARGWTLLSALRVILPDHLRGLEQYLRPSPWTHFDRAGSDRLRELILARRLQ